MSKLDAKYSSSYLMSKYATSQPKVEEVKKDTPHIPILQTGGIGDLIISLPVIDYFGTSDVPPRLFTNHPDIAKLFLPWIDARPAKELAYTTYYLKHSDMLNFKFVGSHGPEVLPGFLQPIYKHWLQILPEWREFMENDPYMGNESAHKAIEMGLNRWTLPFLFLGEPYKKFEWDIKGVETREKFITVHDGFDSNHTFTGKSMKSWDHEYWEYFVFEFKREFPGIKVIQLGGGNDVAIRGVDENLVNKIPFEMSLRYLKSSLLHIDTEGGLVHARRLFNKPSMVLFGPTNLDYFGYPENITLHTGLCGDCWWKKIDWMNKCVLNYPGPVCMESIKPDWVLNKVRDLI